MNDQVKIPVHTDLFGSCAAAKCCAFAQLDLTTNVSAGVTWQGQTNCELCEILSAVDFSVSKEGKLTSKTSPSFEKVTRRPFLLVACKRRP